MIIGIKKSRIGDLENIRDFFKNNYNFEYLDVDSILRKIMTNVEWKDDDTYLFEIRKKVDKEIKKVLDKTDKLVISYSLLEDTYIYDKCNLLINIKGNNNENYNILKEERENIINSKINKKYHLTLNNNEYEKKIKNFLDYNMKHKAKVTIVVPVYNGEKYINRCVESIIHQTYQNIEIILIDDGSTDKSGIFCDILKERDSRIKVYHEKNSGLAETRNKGIDYATGEYIAFIDSDDYIEDNMIESLLKDIEKYNADVAEGSFYIHMLDKSIKDTSRHNENLIYIEGKEKLLEKYANGEILIPAWDKLYKLESIKDIKYDKDLFKEDSDYIYKLCREGKTFVIDSNIFYHYIKRKDSLTGNKFSDRLFNLGKWGEEKYEELIQNGEEYRDTAEKILFNSLSHIIRNYIRDYKRGLIEKSDYKEEIQSIVNRIMELLLHTNNIDKFREVDIVLDLINYLEEENVIEKDKVPSLYLPCIGILWNSLEGDMMSDALNLIKEKAEVIDDVKINFQDNYRQFIDDIYLYNDEVEGVRFIKSSTLIDKFDTNDIMILNMIIKVSTYVNYSKLKGHMFKEVAELKNYIRKYFKNKIKDYAYDNIFHLTVDNDEYKYTDEVCKKYLKEYKK